MSALQLQRIESNGTATSLNDHFNLQLIPKQQLDQAVNNDLTGNTLASETQRGYIPRRPSVSANGVNVFEDFFSLQEPDGGEATRESRRLSISEYDVDNAGYYEYEYFGKKNDDMTPPATFNDNDEDIVMMSDDEVRPFEFDLAGMASGDAPEPQLEIDTFLAEEFTDPLIYGADEPQRKKMRDYFKLNIFSSNSGAADDRKKYFWSRKKKSALKNYEEEELVVEETSSSIVINPSKLISNHHETVVPTQDKYDDGDEYLGAEPISQFTVFDAHVLDQNVKSLAPATAKRNSSSMPKPRGRKPSPIPDASKQYGCEYCDRRFKRQEHLKRHIRSLHMGEKPFNCLICGKKFSRSDNLNQHVKTHSHQGL
ncbi:hypothetical protein HG536_0D02660 [Torulaspora globosa]|uniref:C2H2-type domain-containing protein n=1 Tax=Torulaspora globosa TaxID=48254 RepID=A0A7G3ZGV8_9SACH|nr:uncharacterized protein HG536_0D02660 [Torulaspora globosa]QLL32744.1 hypothetical protein HG536_0D02660 [Torulaspora globosa]